MSRLPTVAIIGRPNTGKSTLFNRLVGRRKAIVSDVPGTTRDTVAARIETEDLDFLLVDTGGVGGGTEDKALESDVERQSLLAIENADVILFTINSKELVTGSDLTIVDFLRKKRKSHVPVLIVPTKCDRPEEWDAITPQYYEFGIAEEILPVSAAHNLGIDELRDAVVAHLRLLHFTQARETRDSAPRIAVLGKPNVGKSSIINALMSDTERAKAGRIVSDIPGTTRDAADTVIRFHEEEYVFVDTAGIRRHMGEESLETFAYFRSIQALEEADIVVLVLDASEPLSRQDKRIAGLALEEGKGLIFLLNKCDLLTGDQRIAKLEELRVQFPFCRFAPVLPCSAETKEGLLKVFPLIEAVVGNRARRIATADLQRWYRDAVADQPLGPLSKTKFITQAEEPPPTFVVFVRNPKAVHVSQLRYLENRLRETFGFEGTPVRWITKLDESKKPFILRKSLRR